jgi:hypothetical protein
MGGACDFAEVLDPVTSGLRRTEAVTARYESESEECYCHGQC